MSKISLSLENVSFSYKNKNILNNISFNVKEGEFIGLIGPNGTGKSTLLRTITDTISINSGKILINGKDNKSINPKERAKLIAVVPQRFDIEFDFSVRDIIAMGRNPYLNFNDKESKKDNMLIDKAMELTNTSIFKNRIFNTLSGGEQQMVLIARAIAQDTEIILLDEPTSALDLYHQLEVMNIITELNKKGKTIIAVLHDLNLASRFCNRLILLNHGEIFADSTSANVLTVENIREVYKVNVIINKEVFKDKPQIIPINVIN